MKLNTMMLLLGFSLTLVGCGGGATDNAAPDFTSASSITAKENQTYAIKVQADDINPVTYTMNGGEDNVSFTIGETTGNLEFIATPDFESPTDTNSDNIYEVTVVATNSRGNDAEQSITITIVDVDENNPTFTSDDTISVNENNTFIGTVHADDESTLSYTISGGNDRPRFIIFPSSGELRFATAPDFENPVDTNIDNIYSLIVTATDSIGNTAQQSIDVNVSDIVETDTGDTDDDYIPDNIEVLIGSNLSDGDEDSNNINDGLDTTGIYGDTFFDKQWHIRSLGTATNNSGVDTILGNDLNITDLYHNYMGYNYGNNIIVQIVDTGVDADHEDLIDNMDISRSYDGKEVGDPSGSRSHGTMVAGIMAARAFNGIGVRGIIPFAKIAGSNWLNTQSLEGLDKVWLSGVGANEIAVSNNSWGRDGVDNDTDYEDIMQEGTSTLRDGKGRIYVFAAGNARKTRGNANLQYMLSNRFMIAVAALKHDNTHADYSTPGTNILLSGYSGNYYSDSPTIGTTTIMGTSNTDTTWTEDTNGNYTFVTNGTSAASPTVAASIALVLEACPDLSWRDIKYLAATYAERVDFSNSSWTKNNSGLWHSSDYGFGLINTQGMISKCTSGYTNLTAELNITATFNTSTLIPDDGSKITFNLNMSDSIAIEWIELTIDNNNQYASDYRVELTSPANTKVTIMPEGTMGAGGWMNGGFRLSTSAMMSEDSNGTWRVDITDKMADNEGTLNTIQLKIYGH